MKSCSDVHNYLLEQGVQHEIVHLPAVTNTAARAARQLGVSQHEIVKSLLFITDKGPVMALVPGNRQASPRLIRSAQGCRRATLAKPDEVLEITGYRPGAVPPCGIACDAPCVMDESVLEADVVYCGGGTTTTMLKIRSADLRDSLGARVANIVAHPEE